MLHRGRPEHSVAGGNLPRLPGWATDPYKASATRHQKSDAAQREHVMRGLLLCSPLLHKTYSEQVNHVTSGRPKTSSFMKKEIERREYMQGISGGETMQAQQKRENRHQQP